TVHDLALLSFPTRRSSDLSRENDVVRKETFMRRLLLLLLAGVLALPLAAPPADTAEDRLVVYTAYEENELKTFWEQFKKDLPDRSEEHTSELQSRRDLVCR